MTQILNTPKISLPYPLCFASGELIPFKVTIIFTDAPALVRLLAPRSHLKLLKRTRIWYNGRREIRVRNVRIASGEQLRIDTSTEGVCVVKGVIRAGTTGRECSWQLYGVAEVQVSTKS
jgi:hypothetical protein